MTLLQNLFLSCSRVKCLATFMQCLQNPACLLFCSLAGILSIKENDVTAAILLIKAAHEWQNHHSGKLPSSSAQRSEFKDIIKSWQRQIDGIPIEVTLLQCVSNTPKLHGSMLYSGHMHSVCPRQVFMLSTHHL